MADLLMQVLEDLRRHLPGHAPRRLLGETPPTTAEKRAETLLQRHLSPSQQRTLKHHGWFNVEGKDGSVWTIRRAPMPFNVIRTSPSGNRQPFCSQLRDAPRADTLLVQKLCIEATGGKGLPVTWDGVNVTDEHLFRPAR